MEIIEPCGFPLSDRAVRRVAMDYGQIAQVTRHASWTDFLSASRDARRRLLLFTTRAAQPFQDFQYRADDTLLFGRESAGVPDEVHDAADARVIIPLISGARSLNLATTAAMALGEALRQTNGFPEDAGTG